MQRRRPLRRSVPIAVISLVSLVGALCLARAAPAAETEKSTFEYHADRAVDAAFVRPAGMIVVLVGAGLFVPAAVITSPGGMDTINEALEFFVLEPSSFVFERPLGDL